MTTNIRFVLISATQAAEHAECRYYSALDHEVIASTLEVPLAECIFGEAERLRVFARIAEHLRRHVTCCRWAALSASSF